MDYRDESHSTSGVVAEQIARRNPWYVESHLEWAQKPSIRLIYQERYRYLLDCIERARARLGPKLRLLDAGCGDGYWLARLSNIDDLDLTGADFNPVRVERARQVVPQAHILHRDLANLKTEEPFDIILLNQVVEHVKDDDGLLHAMREMLRPGGTLILGTPNEGSALQRWSRLRKGTSFQTDHVHFYAETQIRRKILRAGFVIDSVMHEAFYVGSDRLYYSMTKRKWGFKLLQLMSRLLPSQCSDFYFECRLP